MSCRKSGGTLYSVNLVIPSSHVSVIGETRWYSKDPVDFTVCTREFCPTCGSPIRSVSSDTPEACSVKGGLFNPRLLPKPSMHLYHSRVPAGWQEQAGVAGVEKRDEQ